MKKFNYLLGALLLIGSTSFGQSLSGIAVYKSDSKMQLNFNNHEMNGNVDTEEMQKQLRKAMQRDYELRFDMKSSNWEEKESLESTPTVASGGMMVSFKNGGGGILYKNIQEKSFKEENDVFGKEFLVEGELNDYKWQLIDEYKNIGSYKCQKAIFTETVERQEFSVDDTGSNKKTVTDTVTYTAWFTPEIPVSHGPSDYWGLPGLIMEVTNGRTTLICSQLTLNPEKGVEIVIPSKGKAVTQEEFREIRNKKLEEMTQQYRGKNNGNVIIKVN